MTEYRVFPNASAVAEAAANLLAQLAQGAVRERGRFAVALAGGKTPRATYALLARPPWREQIPWPQVHLFWGDERCVPPDHDASNYRLAREVLLDHVSLLADQVHRVPGELEPEAAAQAYTDELMVFFGVDWPQFDLVLLGMGADGHTASLFPNSAALQVRDRPVVAVSADYQGRPAGRVTLTLPAINAARQVLFLVTGAAKADAVKATLIEQAPLPAAMVRPESGGLLWLLDAAAAGQVA